MASSDGLQYRALYEYKKEREEDLALCPGDLLAVSKAGLLGAPDYKEGDERSPEGWLNGFNERTKEWGDFPGTYVEYLGPLRIVATALKARPRPLPPTPAGQLWGQAEAAELRLPDQAPLIVTRLIEALEKQGIDNEALYRAPSGAFSNPELKQALLTDAAAVDMAQFDGQTLAEALKWYLHELPCPVIPPAIYSDLVHTAQETQSLEECGRRAKTLLESPALPQQHGLVLQPLTRHFCRVCQNGSKSHLSPRALGELFGEALFRPPAASMEGTPEHHAKILEALIVAGGVAETQAAPGARVQPARNSVPASLRIYLMEESMKRTALHLQVCHLLTVQLIFLLSSVPGLLSTFCIESSERSRFCLLVGWNETVYSDASCQCCCLVCSSF